MATQRSVLTNISAALAGVFVLSVTPGCKNVLEQPRAVQSAAMPSRSAATPAQRDRTRKPAVNKLPNKNWGLNNGSRVEKQFLGQTATGRKILVTTGAPETLNGDPEGLKRDELQAALQGVLGRLAQCFVKSEVTSAVVSFEADPTGVPRGIRVKGAEGPTASCISGIVSAISFPRFSGNPVPIDYPISVLKQQTAAIPETP